MKSNNIKIQPVRNRVAEIYTKVTGSNLIGELMMAAGAVGIINPEKLKPTNVKVTKDNDNLVGTFDVDSRTANKLIDAGGEWILMVESDEIGLEMAVTPDNITAEFVEYSNGTFTVTGDAISITPEAATEGTYEGYGEFNDGVGGSYDYEGITITVTNN